MKTIVLIFLWMAVGLTATRSQTGIIGSGQQPQIRADNQGIIRLIYGDRDKIFYALSSNKGVSFSKPIEIAEVKDMHLGMSRGPQLASSKDYSVVTAIDKAGNIHSFRLNHKSGKWTKIKNVNDISETAKEGLMSVTADEDNNFYAVWLDLRDDNNNKIAFSNLSNTGSWSKN